MTKYKIIHETNSKFIQSILNEGKLLTSDNLNKLKTGPLKRKRPKKLVDSLSSNPLTLAGLAYDDEFKSNDASGIRRANGPVAPFEGQGSRNRRLCDPDETIKNRETFWKHCDEADGVYFRIFDIDAPLKTYTGDVILVFSKELLRKYYWILNTTENFGFYIDSPGIKGESQFSGEPGTTYTLNTLKQLELDSFDPYLSELCVFEDVSLKFLKEIYVREHALESIKLIKNLSEYVNAPIFIF
jgi:Family of unknown function (DUF5863)